MCLKSTHSWLTNISFGLNINHRLEIARLKLTRVHFLSGLKSFRRAFSTWLDKITNFFLPSLCGQRTMNRFASGVLINWTKNETSRYWDGKNMTIIESKLSERFRNVIFFKLHHWETLNRVINFHAQTAMINLFTQYRCFIVSEIRKLLLV